MRYFFITDRIKKGELEVRYCPTKEIIGDFFTKPLQGVTFQKFWGQIMRISDVPAVPEQQDHRSVLEQSVAPNKTTRIPSTPKKKYTDTERVRVQGKVIKSSSKSNCSICDNCCKPFSHLILIMFEPSNN